MVSSNQVRSVPSSSTIADALIDYLRSHAAIISDVNRPVNSRETLLRQQAQRRLSALGIASLVDQLYVFLILCVEAFKLLLLFQFGQEFSLHPGMVETASSAAGYSPSDGLGAVLECSSQRSRPPL